MRDINQIKDDIMSGKISLRNAAANEGVGRDKLKDMLEETMISQKDAQQFRQRMKLNQQSSRIDLDATMEEMVISILKGKMTAKEASGIYHLDGETIRRKIGEFVQRDNKYLKLYIDYCSKSKIDYGNINFKGLIVHMIRDNVSQTEMASEFGIPTRTISRELDKLKESNEEKDRKLYYMAKTCAEKRRRGQRLSDYKIDLYRRTLDELFPDISIIEFDNKSSLEMEKEELEMFCNKVKEYKSQGMTAAQIAHEMSSSISTIRRKKLRLDELKKQEEYKKELENKPTEEFEL